MNALYLCYQSILDPLTRTQVVAYLEGLARDGHEMHLLTFEPRPLTAEETAEWQVRLRERGLRWSWLRYHKRPTVPATAWDIFRGILVGHGLIRKHNIGLIHARSYVPGVMALALKRLSGVRFLLDIRGLMAEEYVDAGVWKAGGLLFRMAKRMERRLLRAADAVIVLTHKAHDLLQSWYPEEMRGKNVRVIPCCVPVQAFSSNTARIKDAPTLYYIGKLGGWYLTDFMVEFVSQAMQTLPGLRLKVLTQSDPSGLARLLEAHQIANRVTIDRVSPEKIPEELQGAQAGLSFVKPCLSKLASSPTKVGEYLAAGVPVVTIAGIGDVDELLDAKGQPVGVILPDTSEAAMVTAAGQLARLLQDSNVADRCRAVARAELDLEEVGWARYREVYRGLEAGSAASTCTS